MIGVPAKAKWEGHHFLEQTIPAGAQGMSIIIALEN